MLNWNNTQFCRMRMDTFTVYVNGVLQYPSIRHYSEKKTSTFTFPDNFWT